ncbi:hypothetical protein Poly51_18070 [Rubripirellula tenax]|uniref:HEAT repeat protein n=1 Tax=Rubripirellula tenax TaxID=2528015 RepID=A0A5C6FE51_9BACT|nr:HEAT repeat domain-containing protein [Rubripirellula tenax]TWU59022.1 hypothetical protein Poly51_18070 [Rubripirellula tenax]
MQSLSTTFETLATTRNEAAIDVLIAVLDDADKHLRRQTIQALAMRQGSRASEVLLQNWRKLLPDDIDQIRRHKNLMNQTIVAGLKAGGESVQTSIEAARKLNVLEAIDELVLLAESSASREVQTKAGAAVLSLVAPLGRDAREDRSPATVRKPILARLSDSVRRFSMHRNATLVEAFLLVSTWGDGDLRAMIAEDGPALNLICDRFAKTENQGVIDLLAGFIRRKSIHPRVLERMQTRTDAVFRDALLGCVGTDPSGNVIRNLGDMGMPKCCHGGEDLVVQLAAERRAALVHLYIIANRDHLETLHLITSVVRQGGPGCVAAAAIGLARCEVPSIDLLMRAAVPVADDDREAIAKDENAKLLSDLIELLEHNEPALVRGVQRVLAPLHADAMLHKFHNLRPRSRRRLGRVVMMIDTGAVQRVRDALRHPVLANRLEAIAMADALAIVDLLSDSFTHISREDHQEARMKAAQVMADAEGDETLRLLEQMISMPASAVRDTAVAALERRQRAKA